MKKLLLSWILFLTMIVSLFPVAGFAEEIPDEFLSEGEEFEEEFSKSTGDIPVEAEDNNVSSESEFLNIDQESNNTENVQEGPKFKSWEDHAWVTELYAENGTRVIPGDVITIHYDITNGSANASWNGHETFGAGEFLEGYENLSGKGIITFTVPNNICGLSFAITTQVDEYSLLNLGEITFTIKNNGEILKREKDNCWFTIDEDGLLTVGGEGTAEFDWCYQADSVKEAVVLPGITDISGLFWCCDSLEKVTLPDSVTTINSTAFHGCSSLSDISLPNTITAIGDNAFNNCYRSLYRFAVPESVTVIGDYAFYGCDKLECITIPPSVTEIGENAFYGDSYIHILGEPGSFAEVYANNEDIPFLDWNDSNSQTALHSWDDGIVTKEATTSSEGEKTFTCSVCRTTKTESIPKLDKKSIDDNGVDVTTLDCAWGNFSEKQYWYEGGVRQGTYDDANGVVGDGTIRGREIYDPKSNGWYWLDACYDGAKAVSKEVWMPYIYQNEASWGEDEIWSNANASDSGMAQQVHDAITNHVGKWVRYNADGKMYKGWCTITDTDEFSYCKDQIGHTYYYDTKTGLMAKGWLTIDGKTFHFDETTGVLIG